MNQPNQTPTPNPNPSPLGNDPAARNADGSLKDPAAQPKAGDPPPADPKAGDPPEAKEGDQTKDPAANPLHGAPEKYTDFKVADGQQLDPKVVEAALPLFKEMDLSQDGAQKLIDFYNGQMKSVSDALVNQAEAKRTEWRGEVAKDSALGNGTDGLKPEVSAKIAKVIDTFSNAKEFREAMDFTGAGDHPAFVRAILALYDKVGEGTPVKGGNPSPAGNPDAKPKSAASALFPNLPSANS